MDPRLRAAVDASVAWYDDVFALHAVPTRTADGLWWSLGEPPPWHSSVKTVEPGMPVERVLSTLAGLDTLTTLPGLPGLAGPSGTVADSFGDLDLRPHGLGVLIDATWVHHPPPTPPSAELPRGWTVVRTPDLLAEWNRAHDYAGVLVPAVLDLPAFAVLARHSGGALVGGAVVHCGRGAVGLSNTWTVDGDVLDHTEVLASIGALHPGAPVTDYAQGADLDAMVAAGYATLGPQRVWAREER